jgi:hypothetical protein
VNDETLPTMGATDALAALTEADAERFRLVVTPDPDADGPIQWGHLAVWDLAQPWERGGLTVGNGDDPVNLSSAFDRFRERFDTDAAVAALTRYAAVFHGVLVRRWQPTGYSQSDWADALVYLLSPEERAATLAEQAEPLDAWLVDADAWFRGDVYGVRLERDIEWMPTEGGDARMHTWETVEECALWGNYLTRAYTAADVAAQDFGVPEAFAAAVRVVEADQ